MGVIWCIIMASFDSNLPSACRLKNSGSNSPTTTASFGRVRHFETEPYACANCRNVLHGTGVHDYSRYVHSRDTETTTQATTPEKDTGNEELDELNEDEEDDDVPSLTAPRWKTEMLNP